jgi:prophage tail gpP-like protein
VSGPLERISVSFAGGEAAAWSEVSIDYAVDHAVRTASLTMSDIGGALRLRPSMPCTLSAGGEPIITGYIRDVKPSFDGDRHSVSVSIVSRTVDLVEASIDHPTGFLKDQDLKAIAQAFDTEGVGVDVHGSYPKEARRLVNLGESWFDHVEPLARSHFAFIYDDEKGRAQIADKIRGSHAGGLSSGPGGNIIAGSATLSERERFGTVKVRGQSSRGETREALQPEAEAQDGAVGRKRTRIIVIEGEATPAKLKKRAEVQIAVGAGYSTTAQVTVSGWRDRGGMIFRPHYTIHLAEPRLYVDRVMAIQSVRLTQSIGRGGPGTRAELTLVEPRALGGGGGGGGGKGKGSDAAWEAPDPQAAVKPVTGRIGVDY